MRVAADDQLARRDQSLLGQHDVLDAAASDVEEVRDLLLDREVFHEFGKFGGLRVLRRNEVIFDQRDLLAVEDAIGALDPAHHPIATAADNSLASTRSTFALMICPGSTRSTPAWRARIFSVSVIPMRRTVIRRSTGVMQHDRQFGFSTRAIHAGTPPDPVTGARAAPIYQTAAFVFGSTEQAAELFALRGYGHIYSRISNPTVAAFEERMASLEGGLGAIAFSSGLAAQLCTVLSLAQTGDHLVCSQNVYGGTYDPTDGDRQADGHRHDLRAGRTISTAVRAAIRPNTRMLLVETIANPSGAVADIAALARVRR